MYICSHCNKTCKSLKALRAHECVCPQNPNRKIFSRKWAADKKEAWSQKCQATKCNQVDWSADRKQQASLRSKEFNQAYWTAETRLKHSNLMTQVVLENIDSYTKHNVSGRVKMYEVESTMGLTKVKGKWELAVANWLNEHQINWTNNISPYPYFWKNSWHLYFPDFLILNHKTLLEVKGYETDRDVCKWNAVVDKLVIIRENEIKNLDKFMLQFIT